MRPESMVKLTQQNSERMHQTKMQKVRLGTPILNHSFSVVWGYFAKDMEINEMKPYPFTTASRLLGVDSIDERTDADENQYMGTRSDRETAIIFTDGIWHVSYDTIQKDLSECADFIMSPVSGPESVFNMLTVLLQDKRFTTYAQNSGFDYRGDTTPLGLLKTYYDTYAHTDRRRT